MIDEDTPRGTRVRCIDMDDVNWQGMRNQLNSIPKVNHIYTVREIVNTETVAGVRLLEIQNPVVHYDIGGGHEPCWGLHRFELADN